MAGDVVVRIEGVSEAKAALRLLPIHLQKRVLLGALRTAARLVQKAARSKVRVLSGLAPAALAGRRTPGLVKRKISVRVSKTAKERGAVGVFVGVRPAPGARYRTLTRTVAGLQFKRRRQVAASKRGTKDDPFYWQWLEFKTAKRPAYPFLRPAAAQLPAALAEFSRQLAPQIRRLNRAPKEIKP